MKNKYRNYTSVNVHTVRYDAIDSNMYKYLADMISELKSMKSAHEMIIGTPDMISYSLGKTIDYCERNMKDIEMRISGKLE